jgi:hypothetical protein
VRIQEAIGEALARAVTAAADVRHERIGFLGAERDGEPLLRTLTRLRNDLVMIGPPSSRSRRRSRRGWRLRWR